MQNCGKLPREQWWDSVANLRVLFCPISLEKVVVGKSLQARRLPNCQTATLRWIIMNEIMTILRNVRCDGSGGLGRDLHPESVAEMSMSAAERLNNTLV